MAVLDTAMRVASVEGLQGLSIGRLAAETEMSRSGLFELFGSKLELQQRTLRTGIEEFRKEVWLPAQDLPPGRKRLLSVCDHWLSYHQHGELPGGCLMTSAAVEWGARPGPLRDLAARAVGRWMSALTAEVERAVRAGDLPADVDAGEVAFELAALGAAAGWNYRLSGDAQALERARRCMRRLLSRS